MLRKECVVNNTEFLEVLFTVVSNRTTMRSEKKTDFYSTKG